MSVGSIFKKVGKEIGKGAKAAGRRVRRGVRQEMSGSSSIRERPATSPRSEFEPFERSGFALSGTPDNIPNYRPKRQKQR